MEWPQSNSPPFHKVSLPRQLILILIATAAMAQTWVGHTSGTTASLRGVSTVNPKIVWASGTNGTYLHTADGGATWKASVVPGAEQLDFRAIHALDDRVVYLLSSGPGDKSKIYKTIDGGSHWSLLFTNPDAQGFFDALAFWDKRHAIVAGDPVNGHFSVFTTEDGGAHWQRQIGPVAGEKEGAFAASNSCLLASGKREAWITTGGPGGARVFHSTDGGRSWVAASTPIRSDSASAGIFSLAFADARNGIAVGGDYTKASDTAHNIAVTRDGGRTFAEPLGTHPAGYRSAVAYLPSIKAWIASGTSGSDISTDYGQTWKQFDAGAFNALAVAPGGKAWAVGPNGRLAEFQP
jgi:photosystem II stability/assembly factor-like uncharacterized protein